MDKEEEQQEEPSWTVEKFVGHQPAAKSKEYWELLMRWAGYDPNDDMWESLKIKRKEFPDLIAQYIVMFPELDTIPEGRKLWPWNK